MSSDNEHNEMPKLLANWLLTSKNYDTDTDDDSTVNSDADCPFDVRLLLKILRFCHNFVFTSFQVIKATTNCVCFCLMSFVIF